MQNNMLEINVKKRLKNFTVEAVFSTESKGVTALFGASGAGKTTIINMIAGLITPDEGFIRFNGKTLFDSKKGVNVPVHKRATGYVFQDGRLFPNMTVRRNLLYGVGRKSDNAGFCDITEISTLLGISHLLDRYPKMLSGGEKQRVAIGRAMLSNPEILLMDEPLAALDRTRKNELMEYIGALRSKFNIPVLYVTHSYEEIIKLADKMARIDSGILVDFGDAVEILNKENEKNHNKGGVFGTVCEGVISSYNENSEIAVITFAGGTAEVSSSKISEGSKVRFRINATDIVLCASTPPITSVRNAYRGTISQIVENDEHFVDILLDIGTPMWARISGQSMREMGLSQGSTAYALVKSAVISDKINIIS